MKKGEIIGGYRVLEDFKIAGGQSKISFAEKGGITYFIKEFLSPKYPVDGSPGSAKSIARRRKKCEDFEKHQMLINGKISTKCSIGGNLVFAIDFFRQGTTYYKINEKIDVSSISITEISMLPLKQRILILKTVLHSLQILHRLNIVHGDLKPDNVLIKKTGSGKFVAKLIDFDHSYISGTPPENIDDLVGDQVYYSPELANYIISESELNSGLTIQSDIFAIGILFAQYLTGEYPIFDTTKNEYPWQAVLNGETLRIKQNDLPDDLCELINSMYAIRYESRPTTKFVFDALKGVATVKVKKGSIVVGRGWGHKKPKKAPKPVPPKDSPKPVPPKDSSKPVPPPTTAKPKLKIGKGFKKED